MTVSVLVVEGDAVGVGVAVRLGVTVNEAVSVGVAEVVREAVGDSVEDGSVENVRVGLPLSEAVAVGVPVGLTVRVGVAEAVVVAVLLAVPVPERVAVPETVTVALRVGVAVTVSVPEGVGDCRITSKQHDVIGVAPTGGLFCQMYTHQVPMTVVPGVSVYASYRPPHAPVVQFGSVRINWLFGSRHSACRPCAAPKLNACT